MKEGLTAYLGAFIDELARSGVRNVVVSPGSRSTPLALLAAEHPELKLWLCIDERSAGFFALGMSKASRAAVALICTSGTAAANYFPAVAEANLSRVPLIVLTADRPHELRDVGAPQTIQQIGLYGSHVKWFAEMPLPDSAAAMVRHSRMTASRAAAAACASPRGPVHLNFPLREPLLPDFDSPALWGGGRGEGCAYTAVSEGKRVPETAELRLLAAQLSSVKKGLLICGPHDEPEFARSVTELAELLQYPVLADPLSQLRSGSHSRHMVIDSYDAFLRDERTVDALQPEVIIRFGAMPVSKPLLLFMQKYPACRHIVIDEGGGWREPTLLATDMVYAHPVPFCRSLAAAYGEIHRLGQEDSSPWAEQWISVNQSAREVLEDAGNFATLFEGRLFLELERLMPEGATLFVGNSMPIRDLDTFYGNNPSRVRTMGNRGANGIDGLVSTACGAAAAGERVVLVLGDLSFYHDMNGLLAAKLHRLDLTVIIVNNDGGGIFSFLPQAQLPRHFEELFGTPTGLDFEHAAKLYEGSFARVASWESFRASFEEAGRRGGLNVIEIPTERESNVKMHRQVWERLSERLAFGPAKGSAQ